MKGWIARSKKILGILKNYDAHAKEMNGIVPGKPLFFLKPTTSFLYNEDGKKCIEIPPGVIVNHEVELGVIIGKTGRDISMEDAYSHIAGYCLMLDMTARNLQAEAKEKGLPWDQAKGFDTFAPVSEFIPVSKVKDPHNLELWLNVNDVNRQKGNTKDMVYKIDRLISELSQTMTLEVGDFISTGTPEGIGALKHGDVITAGITGYNESNIRFEIKNRVKSKL
jgi:acylpyruvate hydrolase